MSAIQTARRFHAFGTTIFSEMTALAITHKAINLAQGFPDFDGPAFLKQAAIEAIEQGANQYSRMQGMPVLNEAVAAWWLKGNPVRTPLDPHAQITVTSGCTEALAACMLGLVNPGDEVVLFEPYYDSYRACVAMAGATPVFVTMRERDGRFCFDPAELKAAMGPRTRAILLNTPHNPTGTVLNQQELASIARLCCEHDVIAISDEVYERLVFGKGITHRSIADEPGMADRTVVCSSSGKTFSLTGWKIGWAIASEALSEGVRAAHQFTTFSAPTPLQIGIARALGSSQHGMQSTHKDSAHKDGTGPGSEVQDEGEAYIHDLLASYAKKRRFLCDALAKLGFGVIEPEGTYFIMADHSELSRPRGFEDDIAFCRYLTTEVGVAAIPPSAFYEHREEGQRYIRLAFCKQQATLDEAVKRLAKVFG